jgi:hypothetical protein
MTPELSPLLQLKTAVIWNAKLNAFKGMPQSAFESILDCYRTGRQKCAPNSMGQRIGLRFKNDALQNALIILGNMEIANPTLKFLQNALQKELNDDTYVPDVSNEKLRLYDTLQRMFLDNGKGTGRLAWTTGPIIYPIIDDSGRHDNLRLKNCFTGPTRNEIAGQIEQLITISGQVMAKTPLQIQSESYDYFAKIEEINKSSLFFEMMGFSPRGIFDQHHKTKARGRALITILAALRFKADTGQFPESLEKLVSAGYLQALPYDPYSSGPLVYKLTEDSFKLYSVGVDLSDNGGMANFEQISSPNTYSTNAPSKDIVYWPIQ